LKSTLLATSVLAALGVFAVGQASATNMFNDNVSNTGVIDGASLTINGTLNDSNANAQPWVAELYAGTGECLRLFVSSQAFDAKLTVISPNGEIFRDDDSGGSLRPLVEINGAPVSGWYTVQVAGFSGLPQNGTFTLLYGRYLFDNPNCSSPTQPLILQGQDTAAKEPVAAPASPPPSTDPSGAH
jgi:hypothetical protein